MEIYHYFKSENAAPLYPDSKKVDQDIPSREGEKFFLEQACRSVTVQKKGTMPLTKDNAGRVLLLGSLSSFFQAGKQRYPDSAELHFNYDTGPNETLWIIEQKLPALTNYDTIIVCVSSENHLKIAEYYKDKGKRVVLLANMSPTLVENIDWADTILLGYSWRCDYSIKAMLAALNGEFVPSGVKPYKD